MLNQDQIVKTDLRAHKSHFKGFSPLFQDSV